MSTPPTLFITPGRGKFWLVALVLIGGFILSVLSWLELCVEHCAANQDYRLFGLPFAIIGMSFFFILTVFHFLSAHTPFFSSLVEWAIASALGAEGMFILVQKYQIGHWCPVCLSIASVVLFAFLVFTIGHFRPISIHHTRGDIMQKIKQSFTTLSFLMIGFIMAFLGISNPNSVDAAMGDIKQRLAFGAVNSPIEVYFVSDWFCPSCKKIEPLVEKLYPQIRSKVTFYFVDFPIHKKSLNFTPYNLAFLVNNKQQYFRARQLLSTLTEKTETPKDEDIVQSATAQGVNYKELTFLDVKSGMEFFDKIVDQYKLSSTPTIIITNIKNHQQVKFEGRDEISEEKVLQAIEKMSGHSL